MSIQSLRDSVEHGFKPSLRQIKAALKEIAALEAELAKTETERDQYHQAYYRQVARAEQREDADDATALVDSVINQLLAGGCKSVE